MQSLQYRKSNFFVYFLFLIVRLLCWSVTFDMSTIQYSHRGLLPSIKDGLCASSLCCQHVCNSSPLRCWTDGSFSWTEMEPTVLETLTTGWIAVSCQHCLCACKPRFGVDADAAESWGTVCRWAELLFDAHQQMHSRLVKLRVSLEVSWLITSKNWLL